MDFPAIRARTRFRLVLASSLCRFHVFAAPSPRSRQTIPQRRTVCGRPTNRLRASRGVFFVGVLALLRPFAHATHVLIRVPRTSPARSAHSSYALSSSLFLSISVLSSSLPLQKLQRVSTKSTNHSIIKSASALPGRAGVASPVALKFTSR